MNDPQLMAKIKADFGMRITAAVAGSPIPAHFLAALIANESGGDPAATRYEPAELGRFALVLAAKRPTYQGITASQLSSRLNGIFSLQAGVQRLVEHCTSWGLTQIMGWQAIKGGYAVGELKEIESHLKRAVELLNAFYQQFHLDAAADPGRALFHCWNAGAPANPTADPQYADKGIDRMVIYQSLS